VLLNVRLAEGVDWKTHAGLARARDAAERALGASGRVLIRPSGTEPVLRIMVEAREAAQARQLAGAMAQALA
jgi:phosphoglucosamine mutase